MSIAYLGTLSPADPLYDVLACAVYPGTRAPVFHVERLCQRRLVYRYTEEETQKAVVGKFFRRDDPDERRVARKKSEFRNLIRLRYMGFNTRPHSVVNPVSREWRIGLAVAEDYVPGHDLDHYLRAAIWEGREEALRRVLANLASFLSALHSRTAQRTAAGLDDVGMYYARIVLTLERQRVLPPDRVGDYLALKDTWLERPCMSAEPVTVHGDATPTNFLFPNARDVVAIDLERMKSADRVFDIGMVCGELKHAFLWRTGHRHSSEPFIRHFLDQYASHFSSPPAALERITRRVPFYMALTELRIARNDWLDWEYRHRLAGEAHACLTQGLRL